MSFLIYFVKQEPREIQQTHTHVCLLKDTINKDRDENGRFRFRTVRKRLQPKFTS